MMGQTQSMYISCHLSSKCLGYFMLWVNISSGVIFHMYNVAFCPGWNTAGGLHNENFLNVIQELRTKST